MMICSTATVPVNPDGKTKLIPARAWHGFVLKVRDARQFLPPNLRTRCEVMEESAAHIVREATIGGVDLREIIAFEPEGKVTFFLATGPGEGAIVNEPFEDDAGALQLWFDDTMAGVDPALPARCRTEAVRRGLSGDARARFVAVCVPLED